MRNIYDENIKKLKNCCVYLQSPYKSMMIDAYKSINIIIEPVKSSGEKVIDIKYGKFYRKGNDGCIDVEFIYDNDDHQTGTLNVYGYCSIDIWVQLLVCSDFKCDSEKIYNDFIDWIRTFDY